eukprot:CAMPEP_0184479522 /NCGR_PEP_ID=MMETSP0113_2-20130426/1219_1 /TAXON_ID=91329 /ORGANISM="Norrisiella sphaerica, Strain BC52" /LENGTH=121 /DNA_ID=CAMNT_0026857629 /DNA_START=511 /DNA_END=876 /DNA_ORIENTATION=-
MKLSRSLSLASHPLDERAEGGLTSPTSGVLSTSMLASSSWVATVVVVVWLDPLPPPPSPVKFRPFSNSWRRMPCSKESSTSGDWTLMAFRACSSVQLWIFIKQPQATAMLQASVTCLGFRL